MLKVTGQVLNVNEQELQLRDKDKDGNRTGELKNHKMITIQLLVKSENQMFACVVSTFDPPPEFKAPSVGKDWTTPFIRSYKVVNGVPQISI